MADPWLSIWPQDNSRRVFDAKVQAVDVAQGLYRIAFRDTAGKQLAVQIPLSALKTVAATAAALVEGES